MSAPYLTIFFLMIAGAVGLFLMLPRDHRPKMRKFGGLVAALVMLGICFSLIRLAPESGGSEAFGLALFGTVAIATATLMICQRKALYSALYFVLTVLSVAALLLLQQAQFLAFALVLVYAGAILVTYVFVLTLSRQEDMPEYETVARTPFLAVFIGFVLLGGLLQMLFGFGADSEMSRFAAAGAKDLASTGLVEALGRELFEKHAVSLEVAGLLLLVAAVGGIAIVKQVRIKV